MKTHTHTLHLSIEATGYTNIWKMMASRAFHILSLNGRPFSTTDILQVVQLHQALKDIGPKIL